MLILGNCVITTVYACKLNKTQIGQQNGGGLWGCENEDVVGADAGCLGGCACA